MKASISKTAKALLLAGTASASENWAGAWLSGTGVNTVSGVVTVPAASIPPGGSSSSDWGGMAWVGIDGTGNEGSSCTGLLQTGIEWNVIDGEPQYNAWYEWFPDEGAKHLSGIEVSPGDVIGMKVVATSSSSGTIYIDNYTKNQSVWEHLSGHTTNTICQKYGEWIVEDFKSGGSLVSFADFTPVSITECSLTDDGGSHDLSDATSFDMEQNGKVLASCEIANSDTVDCRYG